MVYAVKFYFYGWTAERLCSRVRSHVRATTDSHARASRVGFTSSLEKKRARTSRDERCHRARVLRCVRSRRRNAQHEGDSG